MPLPNYSPERRRELQAEARKWASEIKKEVLVFQDLSPPKTLTHEVIEARRNLFLEALKHYEEAMDENST